MSEDEASERLDEVSERLDEELEAGESIGGTVDETEASKPTFCQRVGKFLLKQWFPIGLLLVVGLARLTPQIGRKSGPLYPSQTTLALIVLIFLMSGIGIKLKVMIKGLLHWRLSLLCQSISLVFAPLFMYGLTSLIRFSSPGLLEPALLHGLIVAACVPTTISSAYIMTSAMSGNSGASLFNCSFGNFLGVFMSPMWLFLFLGASGSIDMGKTLYTLALTIVVPTVVGLVIQRIFQKQLDKHAKRIKLCLSIANKVALFIVVYFAFCETFSGDWNIGVEQILLVFCINLFMFVTLLSLCYAGTRALKFSRADTVACCNNGAQKTLALALPLVHLFVANPQDAGIVAIGIMLYHPMQIFLSGLACARVEQWVLADPSIDDVAADAAAQEEEQRLTGNDKTEEAEEDTSV